jgi:hypothetical protein
MLLDRPSYQLPVQWVCQITAAKRIISSEMKTQYKNEPKKSLICFERQTFTRQSARTDEWQSHPSTSLSGK